MAAPSIGLLDHDHEILRHWAAKKTGALATRARIVLACARGLEPEQVAAEVEITVQTVRKWRRRFMGVGINGLKDGARRGSPRRIPAEAQHKIAAALARAEAAGKAALSSTTLARAAGVSPITVLRIRRQQGQRGRP